jgi:hypothetical protein
MLDHCCIDDRLRQPLISSSRDYAGRLIIAASASKTGLVSPRRFLTSSSRLRWTISFPLPTLPAPCGPPPGNWLRPGAGRERAASSPASITPSSAPCWPPPGNRPWPAAGCEVAKGEELAGADHLHLCARLPRLRFVGCRPAAGAELVGEMITSTTVLCGHPPGSRHRHATELAGADNFHLYALP